MCRSWVRIYLSEYRFTHGNLVILYAIHRQTHLVGQDRIPDHVNERVKLCLNIQRILEQSKPDGRITVIWVVSSQHDGDYLLSRLGEAGIDQKIIAMDYLSKNVSECFDRVLTSISDRINPPYMYFIGSVWHKEIYDSVVLSKLKGYRIQFEGALDHRPVKEVEEEKSLDAPKKGLEYYKRKTMDKAIDIVLNRMFPEGRSRT
jgi:hypothetical protein